MNEKINGLKETNGERKESKKRVLRKKTGMEESKRKKREGAAVKKTGKKSGMIKELNEERKEINSEE